MIDLCGEMIIPQFGEYKYVHESRFKPELIFYWVRDSVPIFKKENNLPTNSNQLIVDNFLGFILQMEDIMVKVHLDS